MCRKKQFRYTPSEIDECMVNIISLISGCTKFKILACCCGHRRYNQTIILKDKNGIIFDLVSNVRIPRKKRFYKKDKKGYYFIPEVEED